MKISKEHSLFKIIALILVLAVITPVAIKFTHTFTHHDHKVCSDNSSTHFHEFDTDCNFYKFKLNNNAPTFFNNYTFFIPKEEDLKTISHYFFLNKYQQLHFSLRGPPALV